MKTSQIWEDISKIGQQLARLPQERVDGLRQRTSSRLKKAAGVRASFLTKQRDILSEELQETQKFLDRPGTPPEAAVEGKAWIARPLIPVLAGLEHFCYYCRLIAVA